MLCTALAVFWGWWGQQLALKVAHDFALRLDELYQLFISHVVEVAGLADLFSVRRGDLARRTPLKALLWWAVLVSCSLRSGRSTAAARIVLLSTDIVFHEV